MTSTKHCHVCSRTLLTEQFSRNRSSKDGYQTACKECCKKRHHAYYKKNTKRHRQVAKAWTKQHKNKIKEFVDGIKAKGCVVCGESETVCIDFHHIDPTTKESTIAQLMVRAVTLERVRAEIVKCVRLCSNCHRKVHANKLQLPGVV